MNLCYDPNATFAVEVTDVEYLRHGAATLLARIYQPQGDGPFPALVDVHGGQWSRFDRTQHARIDHALAASGAVVMALDFRLAPQHPYPAQIQDIHYGIRWLKAHAARFHADATSVAGIGGSSGGHGLVLAAMRPEDLCYAALPLRAAPTVDASLRYVISMWGVIDPYARLLYVKANPDSGEGFGGPTRLIASTEAYFRSEEDMREGNPQGLLDRGERVALPPLLCIHGDADKNVPCMIPLKFTKSWRRAGGCAECVLFPGQPHGFATAETSEADHAIETMKRFIAGQVARLRLTISTMLQEEDREDSRNKRTHIPITEEQTIGRAPRRLKRCLEHSGKKRSSRQPDLPKGAK